MIMVDNGVARHLTVNEWLAFLEKRAQNANASIEAFGFEIGEVFTDVSRVSTMTNPEGDPYEDVLVTEGGHAVALTSGQWGAYLEDYATGAAEPLPEYGTDLGEIAPPMDSLSPVVAKILAAGLRGVLAALYECPAPVTVPEQPDVAEAA